MKEKFGKIARVVGLGTALISGGVEAKNTKTDPFAEGRAVTVVAPNDDTGLEKIKLSEEGKNADALNNLTSQDYRTALERAQSEDPENK